LQIPQVLSRFFFFLKRAFIFFFYHSNVHFLVGHIRNIHFPFDIGADTSFSVASEMVEELELTDQDVSTIAMTIDSEIRYHIPSWSPSETPDNNSFQASGQTPETMHVASPMGNESPASLALEILPSGRKYWSDSPKGVGASSPSLHGASNLSYEVDAIAEEGSFFANSAEKECDETIDSPFNKRNITSEYFDATGDKSSQEEISVSLKDVETENINKIATKLETMLVMQREELDELKRKHKLALSDFLNEFSPEVTQHVLNICNMQMPDGEM
jgi:WNK lysine deficient protein kinase